jgi:mannosyltransferase
MKIVYDNLIYSLQKAGGISTYWSELSRRLIRDHADAYFIESENDNIPRRDVPIEKHQLIKDRNYPLIINRFLPVSLPSFKEKFIFHSSYNRVISNKTAIKVTTIHDFVHEKFYRGTRKFLHSYQKGKCLNTADIIITVSENTKRDLLSLHPSISTDKVRVIQNGVSDDFFITERVHHKKPYLLFVGSREHYKNFDFIVKLLKEMPEFDLYIVGKPLNKTEQQLLIANIPGRFQLFSGIDNNRLNLIYNSAYALLYPSSYEGFGIPLLEAMKAGTPFIALNKSSIPEVAGKAGELIDELDIDNFKQAIYKIDSNRDKYILNGLQQVKLFSWEKCYQETIKLYRDLI